MARFTLTSITSPEDRRNQRRAAARQRDRFEGVDPGDIDPATGAPYEDYSSPCIEPHPFGGGIKAGDY